MLQWANLECERYRYYHDFSGTRSPEDKYKQISSAFRAFRFSLSPVARSTKGLFTGYFAVQSRNASPYGGALRDEPKKGRSGGAWGRFGRASLVAMRSWQICPHRTGDEPVAVCFCDRKETAEQSPTKFCTHFTSPSPAYFTRKWIVWNQRNIVQLKCLLSLLLRVKVKAYLVPKPIVNTKDNTHLTTDERYRSQKAEKLVYLLTKLACQLSAPTQK